MKYLHRENGRKIRVYNVDPRFTLEDTFAKIKLFRRRRRKQKFKITVSENRRQDKPFLS